MPPKRFLKKQHSSTKWMSIIHAFFLGIEYSCIYVSLLYYLDDAGYRNPSLYFCIIMALTAIASLAAGLMIDRYPWLQSNMRRFMIITTLLSSLGNMFYTMQFSILFILFGRFVCGMADATKQVVLDTFFEYYSEREFDVIASKYQLTYVLGFVIGPLLVAMLSNYRVDIGHWHITRYNGIGFVMGWFFLALFFLIICLVKNVNEKDSASESKEELEKQYEKENDFYARKAKYEAEIESKHQHNQQQKDEKKDEAKGSAEKVGNSGIFSSVNSAFLSLSSILVTFISNSTEALIVIITVQDVKLPLLNFCFLVTSCLIIYMFALVKLWKKLFNREDRRISPFVLCISFSMASSILLVFASRPSFSHHGRVFSIFLTVLFNSVAGIYIDNATQNLLAVVLAPPVFEKVNAKRAVFYRLSGLCGLLFAWFLKVHLEKTFVAFIIVQCVILLVVFIQRKKLEPKSEIDDEDDENLNHQ